MHSQKVLPNSDYGFTNHHQPQRLDYYKSIDHKQRQSRSKSTRARVTHEATASSNREPTENCAQSRTSESTIYHSLAVSASSTNTEINHSNIPAPPPPPPLNEDLFKARAPALLTTAKKVSSIAKLPEQMEKNFDDVMNELKAKLKLKNERVAKASLEVNPEVISAKAG